MNRAIVLAILLMLGMVADAQAFTCNEVANSTTTYRCSQIVFNDSGSTLTSGSLVVWDNDDTEFDRSGYPYVTTTTSADSPWTAGVLATPSCADQTLCEMVIYGPIQVRTADSTDNAAEDTLVSTSTVAGQAGDYGPAANTCALGMDMEDSLGGAGSSADNELHWVFVDVDCQ